MRYVIARLLWRLRFPSGFLTAANFRPYFDGHLPNAVAEVLAGMTPHEIETTLARRLQQSFRWMRLIRFLLRPGDRVQFCLGTQRPTQQYMKAWSSRDELAAGTPPRDIAEYWR